MRIAIVGCRTKWLTEDQIRTTAREVHRLVRKLRDEETLDLEIVSGEADGVDTWAKVSAGMLGVKYKPFPAKWKLPDGSLDRGAGHKRNAEIVRYADKVFAFWDGKSPGTENTIALTRKAGKPIEVVLLG